MQSSAMVNFPPFYTLQIHDESKARQLRFWVELFILHAKTKKLYHLFERSFVELEIFKNEQINRQATPELITAIQQELLDRGIIRLIAKQKRYAVFWKSISEWGDCFVKFAKRDYANDPIYTAFELTQGSETQKEEFHGMDDDFLTAVMKHLESQKKVILFSGQDTHELGIKFM